MMMRCAHRNDAHRTTRIAKLSVFSYIARCN